MSQPDKMRDAMRRVLSNSTEDEQRILADAIRVAARQYAEFTTDQVWPHVVGLIREPRLMGVAIRMAITDKVVEAIRCESCGSFTFEDSTRDAANGNPKRRYRSLIFTNEPPVDGLNPDHFPGGDVDYWG